jgi:hypothetical protein
VYFNGNFNYFVRIDKNSTFQPSRIWAMFSVVIITRRSKKQTGDWGYIAETKLNFYSVRQIFPLSSSAVGGGRVDSNFTLCRLNIILVFILAAK